MGHSNRSLEEFLAALRAHGIGQLVDIRRFPSSRRYPHFHGAALAAALAAEGIRYVHMGELGGRRRPTPGPSPNQGWRSPGFRAYADHMLTPEFAQAVRRLLALARERPTVVMCAEAAYARCHRLLLADYLTAQGVEVRHILDARRWRPHVLTPFARVEGGRLTYPSLV
ncbi:MAG TPA: DUF488 domain-containing protein [Dehalococcoidia bacterium]|nr:DUF488 domain-containing protein [Dehalococcoidia bacterium]